MTNDTDWTQEVIKMVRDPDTGDVHTLVLKDGALICGDDLAERIAKQDPEGWANAGRILDRAIKNGLFPPK